MVMHPKPTIRLFNRLPVLGAIFFMVLTALIPLATNAYAANKISLVLIDNEPSTLRTIKGIKKAIKRYGLEVSYNESILSGDPEADQRVFASLKDFNPDLFITLGSYTTSKISEIFPHRPIIFANVMNPEASGFISSMNRPGGHITGAALDIPPDKQFHYFKRVVSNIKTMGVLYSSETENIINQARIAGRKLGINLVAIKVKNEKEIPAAIDSLCKISNALWSVADHTVYTPQSTQYIILQTLRHGLPMMGFSQSLVEAGGLFTLDFDFKDIGRQAGETAVRVLHGSDPSRIPVTTPGIIYFKYNEKTASRRDIQIPEDLLAIAKEVIK